MTSVPLLSVIGPVSPWRFEQFVAHYRDVVGVQRFLFAFHFPDDVPQSATRPLLAIALRLTGDPVMVNRGPWHERINRDTYQLLRHEAGPGWHMLADSDEFHAYDTPVDELIGQAERADRPLVEGMLLDRVAQDGRFPDWSQVTDLDASFPLGGLFTHYVLGGEPTKVVLAHSEVDLSSGNHEVKGVHQSDPALIPVHHFKWGSDVVPYLLRRVGSIVAGSWEMNDDWVRNEARRALGWITRHDGMGVDARVPGVDSATIDSATTEPLFLPASLNRPPPQWETRSRAVADVWWNWPSGTDPHRGLIPTLEPLLALEAPTVSPSLGVVATRPPAPGLGVRGPRGGRRPPR